MLIVAEVARPVTTFLLTPAAHRNGRDFSLPMRRDRQPAVLCRQGFQGVGILFDGVLPRHVAESARPACELSLGVSSARSASPARWAYRVQEPLFQAP